MFIDTRNPRAVLPSQCDICIVGAGAAGITLARTLAGSSKRIILLETGGLAFDQEAQALSRGTATGTLLTSGSDYAARSRLRYFGGSTNHWGGFCRPLDALDFETREWIPHSGWPISRASLDSFYDEACALCDVAPFAPLGEEPPFPGWQTFCRGLFQQGPAPRFGRKYHLEIAGARNVTALLSAHTLRLESDARGQRVTAAVVKTGSGKEARVAARIFVLAAGGLENPRLLLLSRARTSAETASEDPLGRYFMEHPHVAVGRVIFFRPPSPDWRTYSEGAARIPRRESFRLTDAAQRRLRTLNVALTLIPFRRPLDRTREGFSAFWQATTAPVVPHLALPAEGTRAYQAVWNEYNRRASAVERLMDFWGATGISDGHAITGDNAGSVQAILFARAEQAPNPDSRVTLSDERDPNGQPALRLDWRLGELDRQSLVIAGERFASELGRLGLGRVELLFPRDGWPVAGGGCHHMGTTRMSTDPRTGVVDANCRVHGVDNLYVAGSSVFPTGGCSNPTLTLVALTLRLADHLRQRSMT